MFNPIPIYNTHNYIVLYFFFKWMTRCLLRLLFYMKSIINSKLVKQNSWELVKFFSKYPSFLKMMNYTYNQFLSGPKSVKIHVNSVCNYNCKYCYSEKLLNNSLSTDKILSLIDELKRFNIQTVELSGGEPFLHKDLGLILDKCVSNNYQVTIYTNGSLINDFWVDRIKNLKTQVIVSIKYDYKLAYSDYVTKKYNIKDIEMNIKKLVDNGVPVVAFITITKKNIKFLNQILNDAINIGAFPAIERYAPVKGDDVNDELGIDSDDWYKAINLIKKVYKNYESLIKAVNGIQGSTCSCYVSQFSIMQNGDILPCQFLPLSASIGNINELSLNEVWQRMKKEKSNWSNVPDDCYNCKSKLLCNGGCKTHVYYSTNTFSGKDPFCKGDVPTTYGHSAFSIIHSLDGSIVSNKKLVKTKLH